MRQTNLNLVLIKIGLEKFKVFTIARDIILKTNNCQLWHTFLRMKYPIRFNYLEKNKRLFKIILN